MKKVLIFLISSVLVGLLISLYYYHELKSEINVKVISIFQTGVYANYDEALLSSDSKTKIFYDGKLYHVYDAIVSNGDAKEKMINFYKQNNIEYYVKDKYVDQNLYNEIDKYSKLIEMSDSDALKIINKTVIEKYGDEII